jgi:putative DNA primase/helicase
MIPATSETALSGRPPPSVANSAFLAEVYGQLGGGRFGWTASYRGDPNDVPAEVWSGQFWIGIERQAALLDRRIEDNNYFTPAVLTGDGMPSRRKDHFERLAVLVVDDMDPADLAGRPSYLLQTSPGKHQIGVMLDPDDPAVRDRQLLDRVMSALADRRLIRADRSGNNLVRYVRLPVGRNGKGGRGCAVQLLEWNPAHRLTLEEALAVFGIELSELGPPPAVRQSTAREGGDRGFDWGGSIAAIVSGESLHDPLTRLAAAKIKSGQSEGATVNELRALISVSAAKGSARGAAREAEIPRIVSSAARKFTPSDEPLELPVETGVPYPLDALPDTIRGAVREVAAFVQSPVALAACSALGAASVAVQGLANVRRDDALAGPCGVFVLVVAQSGDRKSSADRHFTQPLREAETALRLHSAPKVEEYRSREAAWTAEREGILAALRKARAKDPADAFVREMQDSLTAHDRGRPRPVKTPLIVMEDATAEAIAWQLARVDGWPSAGIFAHEGGAVLGGHSMRAEPLMFTLALFNRLWDGADIHISRRTSESFHLKDSRFTLSLAVQPETLRDFLDGSRGLARGSGFLARCLIAAPESLQGTRIYRAPPDFVALRKFQERLKDLAVTPLPLREDGTLEPRELRLSIAGHSSWVSFHDEVERELRVGGAYESIRDAASKAAENCARLAAMFHVFEEGLGGEIGAERVEAAAAIMRWHLTEARRLFGSLEVSEAVRHAAVLERWLRERGKTEIERVEIQRFGPSMIRPREKLEAALGELRAHGRIVCEGRTVRVHQSVMAESAKVAIPAISATGGGGQERGSGNSGNSGGLES